MPTIVGILTFKSMINFVLNWVEYKKSFITSGADDQDNNYSGFQIKPNKKEWL